MAPRAFERLVGATVVGEHSIHQIAVATYAVLLHDPGAFRFDHDRLVEILERKGLRMFESVLTFGEIFGDEAVGHVAIVASGYGVMAGLLPPVVLVTHDVAVDAGLRLAAQIGEPFAFPKSEPSCAQ